MNPETPWLRDQIIAVLTEHGPTATNDVADLLPREHCVTPCRSSTADPCTQYNYRRTNFICTPGVEHHFDLRRSSADIYRQLRALENQGRVERMKLGSYDRRVFWALTNQQQALDEIEQLEHLLAIS